MELHAESTIRCKTRAKAAEYVAELPEGSAKADGSIVRILEPIIATFSRPKKRPPVPVPNGPSIIRRERPAPVTLQNYRPAA